MPQCCVRGCKSRAVHKEPGVSFHALPKDPCRRKEWADAIRFPGSDWKPARRTYVCSKHFAQEHLYRTSPLLVRLRREAFPIVWRTGTSESPPTILRPHELSAIAAERGGPLPNNIGTSSTSSRSSEDSSEAAVPPGAALQYFSTSLSDLAEESSDAIASDATPYSVQVPALSRNSREEEAVTAPSSGAPVQYILRFSPVGLSQEEATETAQYYVISKGSRCAKKGPVMGATEPAKHPLDLSIVEKLKLDQNGFEACSLAHALAAGYRNAAHAMIWAPADTMVMHRYEQKAVILAVLRFDGYLGFAGGLVDPGETPAQAVNREMHEELNVDTSRFNVSEADHLISFANAAKRFACHFYALQLTLEELLTIEKGAIGSLEYGHETQGILRVPLYTMPDHLRGLPVFLGHKFAGTAREQLLYAVVRLGVLDADAVMNALEAAPGVGPT